jgi:hypothetical protein
MISGCARVATFTRKLVAISQNAPVLLRALIVTHSQRIVAAARRVWGMYSNEVSHIRLPIQTHKKNRVLRGSTYILSLEVPPVGALNLDVVLQHGPAATTVAPGTDPIPTSTVRDNVIGVLFTN